MLVLLMAVAFQPVPPPVVMRAPMQQQTSPVPRGGAKIVRVDANGQDETCMSPALARGAQIVAVGGYEGKVPTNGLATHEGHEVKGVVIAAAARGRPLLLILTAYDPVVWDLRRVPHARLRAVFVSGYHAQAVVGAGNRPLVVNTYAKPNRACGDPGFAYKGGSNLDQLDEWVRTTFGRGIDRFIGSYGLRSVAIDGAPIARPGPVPISGAIGAGAYRLGTKVDGPFGMQRLLAQGAIRRARPADVRQLSQLLTRKSKTGRLAPVRPYVYDAYVVLRPIRVPTGMYGGHSVTFLIPGGIPFPQDSGSHNTYWSLATGECRGVACNIDD